MSTAIIHDAAQANRPNLVTVWEQLTSGVVKIKSYENTDLGCYVELTTPALGESRALSPRQRQILERVLFGECIKQLAIDLDCAASTLSAQLSTTLKQLGVSASARNIPLFLVMLAQAALSPRVGSHIEARYLHQQDNQSLLILHRPDYVARHTLSKGELDVVSSLLDGFTYAAIAQSRASSARTVANQVASAYQKLRVSGRLALLCRLVEGHPQR